MQYVGSTIRISVFSIVLAALAAGAGCGGSSSEGGSGGAAGRAGGSGAAGKGVAGQSAGLGGAAGSVTGAGGAFGGGGRPVEGSAGTAGLVASGGAAGAANSCGPATSVCTAGATACSDKGVPQVCVADGNGCANWRLQPACSAAQTCNPTNGACECQDDPACGSPAAVGDFCPTPGATTHSTCLKGTDGCYTVMAGVPCASGETCNVAATILELQGKACGCPPPVVADAANAGGLDKSVKLLGTGCTMAQAMVQARLGSPADDAVLSCQNTNDCPIWQVLTNCGAQQLTGGIDPVTTLPACVCRKPAQEGQYYVDPDPGMSTFMTGPPTGAQFPDACRLRTLTTALKQQSPPVTEVIAYHESSSNVHFRTRTSTPGALDCATSGACEVFPMDIPAGVRVYTADVGSFNPSHYVIDVDQLTTSAGYAVLLNDRASLEGVTIDASATNPTGVNAGGGVTSVVISPIQGAWKNAPAVAPVTATLNQVRILCNAADPSAPSLRASLAALPAQTCLNVRGQAHWTATYLSIVGGTGTGRGILVNHATDAVAGSTASLTASHLNVILSGAPAIGVAIGSGMSGDAGNVVSVTNDAVDHGVNAIKVGARGTAVQILGGTATFNGVDVGSTGGALRGYEIDGSSSPAAMAVNINQGSIMAAPGLEGGVGVHATGGLTTINGTHITGPQAASPPGGSPGIPWIGVQVEQATGASNEVGDVTLTGTATARTVIDTAPLALANATAAAGVVVGTGTEPPTSTRLPRLSISNNTLVTGHLDGIVVNNGRLVSTGTNVSSTGNWRDGLQIFSTLNVTGTEPSDPTSRVAVTGAALSANGRLGVLVRDVAPVALDGVKVVGNGAGAIGGNGLRFPNGTGGIDVQRSQITGGTAFLFNLLNSTVSGNTGCGVTLSGGDDTGVNRASAGDPGLRICGVGVSATNVPGPAVASVSSNPPTVATPGTTATNIGGKVSAVLRGNTVQNNSGVGIYITEARDFDPSSATDDVTEATVQNNFVTGNLTSVPMTGAEPAAGGIYVASSNFTNTGCPAASAGCTSNGLDGILTAEDLGCEDAAASVDTSGSTPRKNHAACTRVRMETFLGNTVACNGRAQLGFVIPQRLTTMAAASGWDIGSNASLVGVTLADRCAAAATPNRLAGYSVSTGSLGLVIPGTATDPVKLQSLVHVSAYGVFWNTTTLASGTDYSSSLAASPQGNNDALSWGVCPGATPVTCPVAVAP